MDIETKIKKAAEDDGLVIGVKSVIAKAQLRGLNDIILSSNCPDVLVSNVSHVAELSEIPVERFNKNSRDLGEICRKPFTIAVLGILKKS
ncbi:MAG: ribosomal L7Ae/L30e/S12e/Gadd45 family protein [archaeon]|nr:ribosomal L7Ae/L30e/S12e/Gadd45 family protein [archaeon]